jgi:hypothetical protein
MVAGFIDVFPETEDMTADLVEMQAGATGWWCMGEHHDPTMRPGTVVRQLLAPADRAPRLCVVLSRDAIVTAVISVRNLVMLEQSFPPARWIIHVVPDGQLGV